MSGFNVINSSNKFKEIVDCLDHGRATTREVIVLEKGKTQFEVNFNFSFTYDRSNGIVADKPIITKISKSNGKDATEAEKNMIISYIEQNYK